MIDYRRPVLSNYIILESLDQSKENNNNKSFHIVNLIENERIVIGRAKDSDVRINDISVSRAHSCLIYSNKNIFIRDLKSKFGTLFLIHDEIDLSNCKKLSLQIGRTYFESNYLVSKETKIKEK